ncbi:hypothetical protein CAEBREN_24647 [Caenorhabditis brenneri]|uniref:Uncharacterized protein n=1 Tax=Caenorhabditis brenneri TaxID=135651 RepID=G0MJ23_CAEBE|nr:hypothetical protein CAEBREN_24647 [Caenorhabditis brenneri]
MLYFWNVTIIELALPFLTFFAFFSSVSMCAQRVPSYRERSTRRTRDDSASCSQKQPSVLESPTTEKEPAKRSQVSQKSQRKENKTTDSIKIMRGRKPNRKPRDPKELKPERSDSQHTEIINVPLGKANDSKSPSNLDETPKARKGKEKKIQFAKQLVNTSKTTTPKEVTEKYKEGESGEKLVGIHS